MTKTHIRILRKIYVTGYVGNEEVQKGKVLLVTLCHKNTTSEFFMIRRVSGRHTRIYRTLPRPCYEHVSPLELLAMEADD